MLALWLPKLTIERTAASSISRSPSATLAEIPLVVVAKIDNALRLTAVDDRAAQGGLAPGMTLADARAMHPALCVVEADPAADARLLAALADGCDRYTPFVALDPPDGLMLDIGGAAHLFGGERALLDDLVARLAARGLSARAAIAGTALAARALARFRPGLVVPPGGEAQAVAPLPVAALELPGEVVRALHRAGLDRIGDLAGRPRSIFAQRFGAAILDALDRAEGRVETPLSPRRPPPSFRIGQRFADPVCDAQTITATLAALAHDLCAHLEREGQGLRLAEAAFFRADGAVRHLRVETGRPNRDPALVLRLFRERLDALADPLDPGFGFDLIRLAALTTEPLGAVAKGFASADEDERAFNALLDQLGARFGTRRVLRFLPQDTHVPEAAAIATPAAGVRGRERPGPLPWTPVRGPGEPPARPLRLLTPPQPIEAIADVPDGPPSRFRWRRASHAVTRSEGPERIALDWWRIEGQPLSRDYFRVEDTQGRRFWIFREGLYGEAAAPPRWFLHGLFA